MYYEVEELPVEIDGTKYLANCTISISEYNIDEYSGVDDLEFDGDIELIDDDGEETYKPAYVFIDTPKGAKYVLSEIGKQVRELILEKKGDKLNELADEAGLR